MNRAIFSSANQDWRTPSAVYKGLDTEFNFTLDPCPNGGTKGLSQSWAGERVYCNPPYSRSFKQMAAWLEKAKEADLAVYLLASRTGTRWFHTYGLNSDEIRFIKGRLHFSEAKNAATFDSVILVFRNKMSKKFIKFRETTSSLKTRTWLVFSMSDQRLGTIFWHSSWRRYCFSPPLYTVFDASCLRDIAEFCEARTESPYCAPRGQESANTT